MNAKQHIEPIHLMHLNEYFLNLKTLSISIIFHLIIKLINNETIASVLSCDSVVQQASIGKRLQYSKNIIKEMNDLFYNLTINKTIKHLTISNFFCNKRVNCLNEILNKNQLEQSIEIISNSFKNLFENNQTIKFLKLSFLDFLDLKCIYGLLVNSTIEILVFKNTLYFKSLPFKYDIINFLFSKLFNLDDANLNGIKHFKISGQIKIGFSYDYEMTNFIFDLLKLYPNSKLNSITLPFNVHSNVRGLINFLESEPSLNSTLFDFEFVLFKRTIVDQTYFIDLVNQTNIANIYKRNFFFRILENNIEKY